MTSKHFFSTSENGKFAWWLRTSGFQNMESTRVSTPGFYYITTTHENHKYQNFKKKVAKKIKFQKEILVDKKMKKSLKKLYTFFVSAKIFAPF